MLDLVGNPEDRLSHVAAHNQTGDIVRSGVSISDNGRTRFLEHVE